MELFGGCCFRGSFGMKMKKRVNEIVQINNMIRNDVRNVTYFFLPVVTLVELS